MEIAKVVAIGLVVVAMLAILRPQRPELAMLLGAAAGTFLLLLVLGRVGVVLGLLEGLAVRANMNFEYLNVLLKIIGVAYLAELGANVSRDAGEGAIASKIELAGKVLVLALAVPIFSAVVDVVLGLLSWQPTP